MTLGDLNTALKNGTAKMEEPQAPEISAPSAPAPVPYEKHSSLDQFLPQLVALQSTQRYLTEAPTFIPQTFQDQIQFVFDGANYAVYFYFNNQWNNIGAGSITDAGISMSDITTNDVSITKHGFAPKLPNNATEYLNGIGTYSTPTDAGIVTSDITTNDVSITKHGFAPKAPNDSSKFLDGTGVYSIPSLAASLQTELFTLTIPNLTADTAGSHTFAFAPKLIFITYAHTSDDMGAFNFWMDGIGAPSAAIPGGGLGAIAGGGWMGVSTGTPGLYVVNPSVSGNVFSFHYGNSAGSTKSFNFWALG